MHRTVGCPVKPAGQLQDARWLKTVHNASGGQLQGSTHFCDTQAK